MEYIYHIVRSPDWIDQMGNPEYRADSLEKEGFIHCCIPAQIAGVHQRYYSQESELLLLKINTALLKPQIRWEYSGSVKDDFPHIYGPINRDAVAEVVPLQEFSGK